MRMMLDTHVLLWAASSPQMLPRGVKRRMEDADERLVSAATGYEIAFKTRRGRLTGGDHVLAAWPRLIGELQHVELPLSVAQVTRAGTLNWDHCDPFDRMLVAQAQLEGLTLLTGDKAIRAYGEVETAAWR